MKISQRLVILFLISALLPVVSVGFAAYKYTSSALQNQIKDQLIAVATRQNQRIQNLNERNLETLGVFTTKLQLKTLVRSYEQKPSPGVKQQIDDIAGGFVQDNSALHNLTIVNSSGQIISTTATASPQQTNILKSAVAATTAGPALSLFDLADDNSPEEVISDKLTLEGQNLGYVVMQTHTNGLQTVTQDYTELGVTGESYLVREFSDHAVKTLLPLRFNSAAAVMTLNDDQLARIATSQTNDFFTANAAAYHDHRVIAAVQTIPATDWRLIVKIDQAEVLAPIFRLRDFALIILGFTTLAVIVLALWFSRIITSPLQRFIMVVDHIRHGDMSQRASVESKDEIGTLATAFNEMTDDILDSRARLIASILGLSQGFIMVDTQGGILTMNNAARRLLQLDPSQKTNPTTLKTAMAGLEGFDIEAQLKICLNQRKSLNFKDVVFKGSFFYIYLSPISIDDDVTGAVVQIADITEEKILQRSRDEFFSIASHELRTPLTAIRGNSALIQQYYEKVLKNPDLHEMVGDIHDSSQRLIGIVNDFLDVSRLEQGKMMFKPQNFNIQEVLSKVASEAAAIAKDKGDAIILPSAKQTDVLVYADKDRVKQVVYNLIGNAMKFTEHGSITIGLSVSGGLLKTTVTDTGPGISDQNQKLLFHKFQQAGSSLYTRDTSGGTGLGLYISRLLLEKMGGTIALEHSELGKGTTFSFTLPLANTEKNTTPKST